MCWPKTEHYVALPFESDDYDYSTKVVCYDGAYFIKFSISPTPWAHSIREEVSIHTLEEACDRIRATYILVPEHMDQSQYCSTYQISLNEARQLSFQFQTIPMFMPIPEYLLGDFQSTLHCPEELPGEDPPPTPLVEEEEAWGIRRSGAFDFGTIENWPSLNLNENWLDEVHQWITDNNNDMDQ